MRTEDSYNRVFSDDTPLNTWPRIARILKKTDAMLETVRPVGTGANERFLKTWRQITSLIATSRIFNSFAFSGVDLAAFDTDTLTDELLESSWDLIQALAGKPLKRSFGRRIGFELELCQAAAIEYGLTGVEAIKSGASSYRQRVQPLTASFVDSVNRALPEQPWKPGVHKTVAKSLRCSSNKVYEAIQQLVDSGVRHLQKDGIVYGPNGEIIAVDEERN